MNRGEIWTVAGGVYATKPRPAVIVQEDLFQATTSVLVVPLTSTLSEAPLLRVLIAKSAMSGLEQDSDAMVDKLSAVRRSNVHHRVGRVSSEQLVEIERSMLTVLGLAR